MDKKIVAQELLKIARILVAGEIPAEIEKWVDEWETDDYPYGRQMRTKAKWYVEGRPGKQRISRTTVDPRTGRLNSPKSTTYGTAAKLGLKGDRAYLVVGSPGGIAVYDGSMQHLGTLFPSKPEFDYYAKALGFGALEHTDNEGNKRPITVHKTEDGADIGNLFGKFTLRQMMEHAGFTSEDINQVAHIDRKERMDRGFDGTIFTIHFKPEANRKDFIVRLRQY